MQLCPLLCGGTKSIMTQVTISKAQENKGASSILALTSQLGQVLKQFMGLYGVTLKDKENNTLGLTVEQWMSAHGVERFVNKNGKKGGYTPGLLLSAWNAGMKNVENGKTRAFIFKNVPAKWQPCAEDVEAMGLKDFETSFRVFTKEEAENIDGKPLSRYMLQEIDEYKWSVQNILKGLRQGKNFQKENDKQVESDLAWESVEHVYIVRYIKQEDGTVLRKIQEVNKEHVTF